ncbi:uncharacterized protein LOC129808483 [Phlebotomus papatasi]|uniref:uncharacterized protein LOC129808483 n=1 Tax=Phlebotomus papatasi TaxID=29031 RepID=UPI002483F80B|nr:uncharacterized protein LOC129808483 [Phlebotomus papatasi]
MEEFRTPPRRRAAVVQREGEASPIAGPSRAPVAVMVSPQPGRSDGLPHRPYISPAIRRHRESSSDSQPSPMRRVASVPSSSLSDESSSVKTMPDVLPLAERVPGRKGRPPVAYPDKGWKLPLAGGHIIYGPRPRVGETRREAALRYGREKQYKLREKAEREKLRKRGRALQYNCPGTSHSAGDRVECRHCGSLNFMDEQMKGESVQPGTFPICCMGGAVKLDAIPQDSYIQSMLTDVDNPEAKHFRYRIRIYNTALSFASVSFNDSTTHPHAPSPQGPPVFWMYGVAYHRISYPRPEGNDVPAFGQLYYLDPIAANNYRMNAPYGAQLDQDILRELDRRMRENNPCAREFQRLHEVEEEQRRAAAGAGVDGESENPNAQLFLFHCPQQNRGTHGAEITGAEIAVVYAAHEGEPLPIQGVVVRPKSIDANTSDYRIIPNWSASVDPLCYPLIRPRGTMGWHPKMPSLSESNRSVTFREYCMYHLMERRGERGGAPLLNFGRLLQQLICDWAHRMEQMKLAYVKRNNAVLRAVLRRELPGADDGHPNEAVEAEDEIIMEEPVEGEN